MKITEIAKNRQATMIYKAAYELTNEEREMLVLPYGRKMEDYADFQVRYNRKGQLLGVKAIAFEKEKIELTMQNASKADVIDTCQSLFGKKHAQS